MDKLTEKNSSCLPKNPSHGMQDIVHGPAQPISEFRRLEFMRKSVRRPDLFRYQWKIGAISFASPDEKFEPSKKKTTTFDPATNVKATPEIANQMKSFYLSCVEMLM